MRCVGKKKANSLESRAKISPRNGYFLGTGLTRGREEPISIWPFCILRAGSPAHGNTTMIILSDKAKAFLETCFPSKEKPTLRIYAIPGPMLILAMDKAVNDEDVTEEKGGFTFCMTRELMLLVREVEIDVGQTGFICTPLVPLPGSSCSGGCAGCSGCH